MFDNSVCDPQVRDYSGTYTVKLIPCTAALNVEYTVPPVCNPRKPVTFDLDIRFQQVNKKYIMRLKNLKFMLIFYYKILTQLCFL